jgi:hypothetical protein
MCQKIPGCDNSSESAQRKSININRYMMLRIRPASWVMADRRLHFLSALGLEREGLRGNWLTINATIGVEGSEEEDGMAGIYITRLR